MDSRPLTKREIVALLTEAGLRPSRRRGQNFLIDGNLLRLIADAPGLGPDDVVLEIGTGLGQLTRLLAERAGHVVSVEVARAMLELARPMLADLGNVEIVAADVLASAREISPEVLDAVRRRLAERPGARFRVVANPPYSVATPFAVACLTGDLVPVDLHLTLQRELAERLASPPGRKSYGAVTVVVQALSSVSLVHPVPATAFWPRPRVDSVLTRLVPDAALARRIDDLPAFRRIVTVIFQSRRKTLHNALGRLIEPARVADLLAHLRLDPDVRPEAVPVSDFIALAKGIGGLRSEV